MAVTTKKLFPATTNATTTVFSPVGIQLNNQDDLDVYVTLSGGTRVLQLRQSTGSTAQSSHPQVNNTDGLYFPAVTAGTTLYNYTLSTDNNTITFNSALPQGAVVFCERRTRDADSSYTTFASGSTIRATDLNNSSTESNFTAQDGRNKALTIEGVLFNGDQPSTNFVTSSHIVDGSIVDADINASADIAGTKLADDSVTLAKLGSGALPTDITVASANIVNGTIVEADIANSAVTQNKLANNSVGTPELINGNVTRDKIAADAIDGTKLADNAVDSEHYTDGSIDRVHLEADIIDSTKLADNAVNSEHYVDGSIDRVHLEADIIDSTKLADNAVGSEHIQANAVTDSEIATGTLDNRYFTETELTNGALDGRYFTETESDARYFNVSTGDTIKDGDAFPDNDTTIATTAAINDRIIDLVDDVGGFVPLANETSFPNTNPDVNNGAGTLVSIKALSQNYTSSSTGVITIPNGTTVQNSTVTITGAGNSVTFAAGFGMIVETTVNTNQYAFHRLVPKATEVTTVAGISANITTVANNTANINAVAADASDIGIVAADGTDIGLVAGSIANVNTTAGSIANVNTTAGSITNVNNVGNNISNVNAVAGNASNINSAVSNASNINSAVSNASNINTVAGSISNVNTTATNISSVNNVSSNISNVNNFNDKYQIAANNPTTDGGGNALAAGDLYFNTSANELKVYNGGAWQAGVTATGNFAVTTGNTFTGNNIFTAHTTHNDNVQARFGTGADLQIFHNGTNSFIQNDTNNLYLRGASAIILENTNNEDYISAYPNAAVQLFYDNSKKFETSANGVDVTGNIFMPDSTTGNTGRIKLGDQEDLQIYHTGSHATVDSNTGNLYLKANGSIYLQTNDTEAAISCLPNGAVELYHDNSKKLETTASGVQILSAGTSPTLNIEQQQDADSEAIKIRQFGNQNQAATIMSFLNWAGSEFGSIESAQGGAVSYTTHDNGKFIAGTGDDLIMHHDGTHSYLSNNTGNFYLRTINGEFSLVGRPNNTTELYYDHSKKLETTSTGTRTTGVSIIGANAVGMGSLGASTQLVVTNLSGNNNSVDLTVLGGRLGKSSIVFGDHDDVAVGSIQYHHSDESLNFYNNNSNTSKLTIKSDGDVGIGTSSPDVLLHVQNSNAFDTKILIESTATNSYPTYQLKNDAKVYSIQIDGATDNLRFYDGTATTERFRITSGGNIEIPADNKKLLLGGGQDLELYHTGTNSFIDNNTGHLYLRNKVNNQKVIVQAGIGGNAELNVNYGEHAVNGIANGATKLYYDNSEKLATTSNGISVGSVTIDSTFNNIGLPDGGQVRCGTGEDLRVYHNGTNSFIENSTGSLYIRDTSGGDVRIQGKSGEDSIICNDDGSVELYYDNSKKLETVSDGVKINNRMQFKSGTIFDNTANGNNCGISFNGDGVRPTNGAGSDVDNARDLGQQSARWRNVYAVNLYGNGSNITGIDAFPSGTVMLFQQTNAPTGWTKLTSHNNKALRLVSGTPGTGGSHSFSTAFNSARSTSGGSVSNHTLTTSQIPSHSHSVQQKSIGAGCGSNIPQTGAFGTFGCNNNSTGLSTNSTGGGGAHNHGFTNPTLNLNVQYVDVIMASKN